MQTVDKAMKLLGLFTSTQPEIGLSELARLAAFDKASTRRLLVALQNHGYIEQHPETKKYRLGAGFLRLSRIREATFPIRSVIQPILERLARTTGETSHASTTAGNFLATIGVAEPARATRVHVDPAEKLPLHATASGLVYLAFSPPGTLDRFLKSPLEKHTSHTVVSNAEIRAGTDAAYAQAVAVSDQGFEDEVVGIAAPYFGATGYASGAIAVATPSSRMTDMFRDEIKHLVIDAAVEATEHMGAVPHAQLVKAQAALRS